MTFKSICDGLFASTLSDDEFAELSNMTKRELAALYVDAQVAAGIIGEPADRAETEAYVSRQFRKIELIDGIVMFRGMEDADDDTTDESECDMDVTRDIADITLWPASTTPVAMRIEESDDMRMRDEFAEIEADLDQYEAEYDELRHISGEAFTPDEVAAMLYEQVDQMTSQWTDEDEKALDEFGSLIAYESDDDDDEMIDIEDEWTEWLVLAGELERIDSDPTGPGVWAWCPDHRAEVPGCDDPIYRMDKAKSIFDAYDPIGLWFAKRHEETMAGESPRLGRRMEVDLVCETCVRTSEGVVAVRDDAVRLSKSFDVDGDMAAQALISCILSHI